jgi:hypothetical protein
MAKITGMRIVLFGTDGDHRIHPGRDKSRYDAGHHPREQTNAHGQKNDIEGNENLESYDGGNEKSKEEDGQ